MLYDYGKNLADKIAGEAGSIKELSEYGTHTLGLCSALDLGPRNLSRDKENPKLPISDTFAVVNMNLSPGVREMHTHRQSEWGFVPVGASGFHYVQNISDEPLQFLEVFNSEHFVDISVLYLPDSFFDSVRKGSNPVVKYRNFEFPYAQNTPQNVCYFKDFKSKHLRIRTTKTILSEPSPAIESIENNYK